MIVDRRKLEAALEDCPDEVRKRVVGVIVRAERLAEPTTKENWDCEEARLHRRLEALDKELKAAQVCGMWTEHAINSRDRGYPDYRDSPPIGALLCGLGPGTVLIETSDPGEPSAHVLRYVGTYEELKAYDLHADYGSWVDWLARWKKEHLDAS